MAFSSDSPPELQRPKKAAKKTAYDLPKETETPDSYGVGSRGEGNTPQIRHTKPEVARHCARVIIACNGDADAAVAKMLEKDYPDATDHQIASLARTLDSSPHVQKEITALLEEIGFGDAALTRLIGLLWKEVLGNNDKRWVGAARLLAEITGAPKAKQKGEIIPTLKLAGMEDGLAAMLGDAVPKDGAVQYSTGDEEDDDAL